MLYKNLVQVYEQLESTSKRLDKTYYIMKLFEEIKPDDTEMIVLLLQGKLYHDWEEQKLGVSNKLVIKALNVATGISAAKIEDEWRRKGDLGLVAEALVSKKKQATLFSKQLTVKKVFDNLHKLAGLEGPGSVDQKVKLVAELLTSAEPIEAKYVVRTVLEVLRVGVGEGSLRDAVVWALFPKVIGVFFYCKECHSYVPKTTKCLNCGKTLDTKAEAETRGFKVLESDSIDKVSSAKLGGYQLIKAKDDKLAREIYNYFSELVQHALDMTNDFVEVIKTAKKDPMALRDVGLSPLVPVKVMLYQKVSSVAEAFEEVGKPAAFEYKYDGFRLLLNKKGKNVKLYTRRLEDVTAQFPDVVKYLEAVKADDYILDSEVIGYDPKTKKWLPFQQISQRIKRKYNIEEMTKTVPVIVNVFDALLINGKNTLKTPFKERRALLKKAIKPTAHLKLADQVVTDDEKKAEEFYHKALALGNEGVMVKNLEAPYKPGSRVGYGVKLKPTMETLDLVITGAEWGTGKRAHWLSSYVLACRDSKTGEFLDIGKVGTGFKEKAEEGFSFEELTKLVKPLITDEKGREVRIKPKIVIEVTYEEIQKSPKYSSGYALRFPRFLRDRSAERAPDDASTLDQVEELYKHQKARK